MRRTSKRLSAIAVEKAHGRARLADGDGLWLNVTHSDRKSWIFRWSRHGKAHEIGLGPYPAVSLARARELALDYRRMVVEGKNPRIERQRLKGRTFGEVSETYLTEMAGRWTNDKTAWQWRHSLTDAATPIADRNVAEVDTSDVLRILKPIWQATPESASRLRMRLEAVLDFSSARGWREGDNPARWKGHLEHLLTPRGVNGRKHHAAMPFDEGPPFLADLRTVRSAAASALAFCVLTAARTGEVIGATWDEIDLDAALWTIPASRMKMKSEHRVPLSRQAAALLQPWIKARQGYLVFPGQKPGKRMSDMAMAMTLRRLGHVGYTVHGFRSSFRDWCGDRTDAPREIAEAALAHRVGNSVELAYRRGDALEKRRQLMQAWADFCEPGT